MYKLISLVNLSYFKFDILDKFIIIENSNIFDVLAMPFNSIKESILNNFLFFVQFKMINLLYLYICFYEFINFIEFINYDKLIIF